MMELDNVYSIIVIKNIKGFVIVAYIIINDICKKNNSTMHCDLL